MKQQRKGFIVQADDGFFNAIVQEPCSGEWFLWYDGEMQELQDLFQQDGVSEVDPPEKIEPWMKQADSSFYYEDEYFGDGLDEFDDYENDEMAAEFDSFRI